MADGTGLIDELQGQLVDPSKNRFAIVVDGLHRSLEFRLDCSVWLTADNAGGVRNVPQGEHSLLPPGTLTHVRLPLRCDSPA